MKTNIRVGLFRYVVLCISRGLDSGACSIIKEVDCSIKVKSFKDGDTARYIFIKYIRDLLFWWPRVIMDYGRVIILNCSWWRYKKWNSEYAQKLKHPKLYINISAAYQNYDLVLFNRHHSKAVYIASDFVRVQYGKDRYVKNKINLIAEIQREYFLKPSANICVPKIFSITDEKLCVTVVMQRCVESGLGSAEVNHEKLCLMLKWLPQFCHHFAEIGRSIAVKRSGVSLQPCWNLDRDPLRISLAEREALVERYRTLTQDGGYLGHGDLWLGNILLGSEGRVTLIDFDNCGYYPRGYDLLYFIFQFIISKITRWPRFLKSVSKEREFALGDFKVNCCPMLFRFWKMAKKAMDSMNITELELCQFELLYFTKRLLEWESLPAYVYVSSGLMRKITIHCNILSEMKREGIFEKSKRILDGAI